MANSRDETLRFIIDATGDEKLRPIAQALVDIRDAGGPAAEQAGALIDELAKLAGQTSAIENLISLKAQLGETAEKITAAKQELFDYGTQSGNTAAENAKLAAAVAKTQGTIADLSSQYNALNAQVATANNSLRAAGVDTDHLDSAQRNLSASMSTVTSGAASLATAHKTNASAQEAETITVSDLAERYGILGRAVENIKTIFATVGAFVGLEKAKDAIGDILASGDKFESFGIKFAAAFGGAEAGQAALEKVKELADQVPIGMDTLSDAAIRARKVGLDPFDGTLKALIDTNLKYGGTTQDLGALIDSLGRSYAKGALGTRELTALQAEGIPVVELLAQALGKTGDQILEMARKGQLGKESIATLIDELAKSSGGAASASMDLLSTQVTKLHDDWDDFLKLIADAGVYDFAKDELRQIGDSIKTGLGDGTLRERAQAISDAIVGLGKAAVGAVQFLSEHAGAIKTVAEAYALIKVAQLTNDLVRLADRWRLSAAAALEHAAAAQADAAAQVRLTAAMEAATVAAGAQATAVGASEVALSAASKGGILQALSSFGSLRAALNGIGTAITGLVGGPIVALVASIGFVAVEAVKLVSNLKDWHDITVKLAAQQKELAAEQDVLVEKAKQVAAQTKASADVQIASADKLSQMSKRQSEDYIEQLQNAVKYYTAMQVQAQAAGDAAGAQKATDHLRELVTALADAKDSFEKASESLAKVSDRAAGVADRFDTLRTQGESAATAISGAFSNIEIGTPKGLQDVLDTIGQITARSDGAKQAVQDELAGALQKLNAQDLAEFQRNVNARLKEAKGNAEDLATALNASLEASLLKLGVSAQQAGVKISEADQTIVTSFKSISENARATGDQVQLAFANALSKVETSGAVDALKRSLQDAFDSGRISAAQFDSGMDAAGRKLAEVQIAAAQAGAKLDGMGVAGQTAAQRISSSLQNTRDSLIVTANQITDEIAKAMAAGDGAAADSLRAQYRALDAQIQDLNEQINKLGDDGKSAGDRMAQGADRAASAMRDVAASASQSADATKEAGDNVKDMAGGGGESLAKLDDALASTRQGFLNISEAAAKAFDTTLLSAWNLAFDSTGVNMGKTVDAMNAAMERVNGEIADQRRGLQDVVAQLDAIGPASNGSFGAFGSDASAALVRLGLMNDQLKYGNTQFDLLGKQDLAGLQSALDAARQKVEAIAQATLDAKAKLGDMAKELHDQILQEQGDEKGLEDERHAQKLADLLAEAKAAGDLNSQDYQHAIQLENQLHALKMQKLQDEQSQQKTQAQPGGGTGSGAGNYGGSSGSGTSTSTSGSATGAVGGITHTFNINLGGSVNAAALTEEMINEIGYQFIQQLKREAGRTH